MRNVVRKFVQFFWVSRKYNADDIKSAISLYMVRIGERRKAMLNFKFLTRSKNGC